MAQSVGHFCQQDVPNDYKGATLMAKRIQIPIDLYELMIDYISLIISVPCY